MCTRDREEESGSVSLCFFLASVAIQRVDHVTAQLSPAEPPEGVGVNPSRRECSSCGASIPANRTKCRFCLSNHLDGTSDDSRAPDTEWTLLHVVHLLVEASTFYAAVAKGAAAATLLTKTDWDPAVDDCQLIYDLDAEPAAQLTEQWPSLSEAVRVTSESGEQLLAAARERTGRTKPNQSRSNGAHTTFLYDEGGRTFVRKIGLQPYWRAPRTTSGWCQRLHSSVPSTAPISIIANTAFPRKYVLSVASAIGTLYISSKSSSLSQMRSGLASRCGSARCVSRLGTNQIPSRIIG
jgi:hypothetical protein